MECKSFTLGVKHIAVLFALDLGEESGFVETWIELPTRTFHGIEALHAVLFQCGHEDCLGHFQACVEVEKVSSWVGRSNRLGCGGGVGVGRGRIGCCCCGGGGRVRHGLGVKVQRLLGYGLECSVEIVDGVEQVGREALDSELSR